MSFTDTAPLPFFGAFLLTGFSVGFGHCIGMCGPIAVSLSLKLNGRSFFWPHFFYNTGRVITYAILGALMGYSGSFTGTTARMAGLQQAVMFFSGIMIIVMGVSMGGWLPMGRLFSDSSGSTGIISRGFQILSGRASPMAYFPLGLLLGLLPCGPVYTALIAAARSGMEAKTHGSGALWGMGLMLAFGIGTIPAMLLVARLAGMGWLSYRHHIYRISAILMILLGGYFAVKAIRW
ncbi:MAG: sulfite exporter TauE/SafE family protein [Pseudomonadota bacterium]